MGEKEKKENRGKWFVFQGVKIAKKWEKWYPNCYDQNSGRAIIVLRGRGR